MDRLPPIKRFTDPSEIRGYHLDRDLAATGLHAMTTHAPTLNRQASMALGQTPGDPFLRRDESLTLQAALDFTEGMIQVPEAELLYHAARDCDEGCIVEVGSYRGRSTVALGLGSLDGAGAPVYAIEPHEAFEGVRRDFDAWVWSLTPAAIVLFDDATDPALGPARLISELCVTGVWVITARVGKVVAVRRTAPSRTSPADGRSRHSLLPRGASDSPWHLVLRQHPESDNGKLAAACRAIGTPYPSR